MICATLRSSSVNKALITTCTLSNASDFPKLRCKGTHFCRIWQTFTSFFYSLPERLRSKWSRSILRIRMLFGVTSTYSSPLIYSKHSSRLIYVLGMTRAFSSLPLARTLVSCLALVTLMTRSLSCTCSPTT